MNRSFYAAMVLLLGLFIAQALSTLQVYRSDTDLYRTLSAINDAGYLVVPNQRIMNRLQEFGPAFFGGLFFTFSVGAGLSLFSLAAAWVWDSLFSRKNFFLILVLVLWIGCLYIVNQHSFCPMATSYILIIPPVVFVATLKCPARQAWERIWLRRAIHFVPVLLLALLWTSQMDSELFLDVRDNLLLSNPLGKKVNGFYYDYTLYPAEAFKSLDQKMLKTCHLENIKESFVLRHMESVLRNYDYLTVKGDATVDLKIAAEGNTLVFENRGKPILRTPMKDFLTKPATVLKEFSFKSDSHAFFRRFAYICILVGFPVILYVILYALLQLLICPFLGRRSSLVVASLLCFLIGLTMLVFFHLSRGEKIEANALAEALQSERWQKRVAALKIVQKKGMEIMRVADFRSYHSLRISHHIPERYWLVRALGVSRQAETYKDLLAFLDDPNPNVVCMAFYALGQRGDNRAIKEIIERIEISDHWYKQWYAYKALRILGWKQTKSK